LRRLKLPLMESLRSHVFVRRDIMHPEIPLGASVISIIWESHCSDSDYPEIKILNPFSGDRQAYLEEIDKYLGKIDSIDIIAVSAGFDSYEKEVGKKLKRFDYYLIGRMLKKFSKKLCYGRRFAILEGGYHPEHLGKNVLAFYQGFE